VVWKTNLHPDGHIYLHAIAGSSLNHYSYTLLNRVEAKNVGGDNLRIGRVRFMRASHLPQGGGVGLYTRGPDAHGILRPGATLFVYLTFASAIPAGYVGMLDIPVLGGHTGVHAHVFINRSSSGYFQRKPLALRSGAYPVFVYEGLHASLEADGSSRTLQPVDSSSGEHLRLSFASVLGIPKGNWALPPPKDPKFTVFHSSNPIVYAREDLGIAAPAVQDGGLLPYLEPRDTLGLPAPQVINGALEQQLYTQWPAQQEADALQTGIAKLLDGQLLQMAYTEWPWQQEASALTTGVAQVLDGTLEAMSYSDMFWAEESPIAISAPMVLDGTLETL